MLARLDTTKPTDMAPDGYREGAREREMHRFVVLASHGGFVLTLDADITNRG